MRYGILAASQLVGFPVEHSQVISQVADQMDTIIAFRDVGVACTGLLREGYATKGFRIDTKSCDWGPMSGFVCADPRLNKKRDDATHAFNLHETETALAGLPGHATAEAPDAATMRATWSANTGPLVISGQRIVELTRSTNDKMRIAPVYRGKEMVGQNTRGGLTLHWRLVHIDPPDLYGFVGPRTQHPEPHYYAICAEPPFRQVLPAGAVPFQYKGHDVLLGMCNPGMSQDYGFKACVTGDYDLFCVWPHETVQVPGPGWDTRAIGPGVVLPPAQAAAAQHWQLGNISRRIKLIKVLLNTHLQAAGNFPTTGQLVHHSDEVGNPGGLAKPLSECFPIIAFRRRGVFGLENVADLRQFTMESNGYQIQLKPSWYGDLRLPRMA